MPDESCCLTMLARAPQLGKVKTRLAAELGAVETLEAYRVLLSGGVQSMHRWASMTPHATALLSLTEAVRDQWLDQLMDQAPTVGLQFQKNGDLGQRIADALDKGLAHSSKALVIGSDCPLLEPAIFEAARHGLDTHDLVISPTEDGGYALLGLKEMAKAEKSGLFSSPPWSSSEVLPVTLECARHHGLSVLLLPTLWDVDTLADWQRWQLIATNG